MTNIPVEQRKNWLGSSEIAAIFNVSPYATLFELWHQKHGDIAAVSLDGLERIEAGKFLEPAIAAWGASKWEWPLRKVTGYLKHPTIDRVGASLDFETEDGEPVEIKNVDGLVFRDGWVGEGDAISDAPIHILLQLQHQLACRPEAAAGWLIPCVGGNKLMRMRVPRHEALIAKIEAEAAAFWLSVDEHRAPKPDFNADAETISTLYAVASGLAVDLSGNPRVLELCETYDFAKARSRADERAAKAARAELLTIIGPASKVIAGGGYKISAGTVAGTHIEYERPPYRHVHISIANGDAPTTKKGGALAPLAPEESPFA